MLHINDLVYRVGGRTIFDRATAHVPAGQKLGLVGRNGAGKTTLLRLVAGELAPDGGELRLRRGARIGMVAQEAPGGEESLIDIVLAADRERVRLLAEAETATDPHRIAEIHERLAAIDAHGAPARAAAILDGLGFDEAARRRPVREYSGGWRMRVALGALLFVEPDLLLLDEPTNYLDLEGALWLENFLRTYPRTLLLVSHDRYFLNRVVDGILHVDNGKLGCYRGGYDSFERVRREQLVLQEKMRAKQEAQARHMQAFVDRFRYKASKARQAQSRLKALARMQPIAAVMEEATIELRFPEPAPLPSPLIALEKASVGYEPDRPVLRRLDLRIDADDRIALLGRNGNGKSTFAKLLAGRLTLESGTMQASPKLRVGYFGQHQIEELNPAATAFAHLAALLPGAPEARVRARLGAFGFSQDKADVAAAELSGGEKARLVFALITAGDPQLLILDEPTNHLDIDSREVLVQALNDYAGAVILVSHDRHLVELAADRLWLVADGTITPFDGDLDDYRAQVLTAPREGDGAGARDEQRPSRKDDRRAGAEARARLAPLRRAAEAAEAQVARLTAALKRLEDRLADPGIYDGPADRITALTRERAEAARALAEAEAAWLEAAEAYEAAAAAEAALSP